MSTHTLHTLERLTAHTAVAAAGLTVIAWAIYIAIGGLT